MPFKSRSQEDLFAASAAHSPAAANERPGTCRDDHAVAMTMTSLLLLRPDGSAPASADSAAAVSMTGYSIWESGFRYVVGMGLSCNWANSMGP